MGAALGTAVALALPVWAGLPAAPAYAADAVAHDDFDGDGYHDLAVSHPLATVNGHAGAGVVVVLYGSANGLSTARSTVVSQASPGVPGAAEEGDRFGTATASADLDRDGYADLIVGSPAEAAGGVAERGSATVVWGGPGGLSGGAELGAGTIAADDCGYGGTVAAGDHDGDGAPDVTVGSRCATHRYEGPFTRAGAAAAHAVDAEEPPAGRPVLTLFGDVDGDGAAERVSLPGPAADDPGGAVWVDDWRANGTVRTALTAAEGLTGAIGDVDGDGYGDLVIGDPQDPLGTRPTGRSGGEITVWYGGPGGIDPAQSPTRLWQGSNGLPGTSEADDAFGTSVGVGDADGDGYADVAVGLPGEDLGTVQEAGSVIVLSGTADGLTGRGARSFNQGVAGVSGAPEYWDLFGERVRLADHDGDGRADLTVGVPGENAEGCLWLAPGGASGPAVDGSSGICSGSLPGYTADGPGFGEVIAP
ncbi:FG-GAP-like repeat-containing protein [Streptomyces sp. RFCAC02]|uniref:FG-GAP repeat protein n=1 Tax=Streptomyces sp. RFCAC02 TaxID=2499143 RepID=UPI0010211549|nr:FG-GAP-like repeat-containing protein [Streptomyces sp. RFCAC02]